MRTLALAAAALFASASAALAVPRSVEVSISPELQAKAVKTYGVGDVVDLANDLHARVVRELLRTGAYHGARVELVLVDVVPNRPTLKQMSNTPGLSFQSFGVGGATIRGRAVAADGTVTPLYYRNYETDIRWAAGRPTWFDAEWTIDRFAARLSRGKAFASR